MIEKILANISDYQFLKSPNIGINFVIDRKLHPYSIIFLSTIYSEQLNLLSSLLLRKMRSETQKTTEDLGKIILNYFMRWVESKECINKCFLKIILKIRILRQEHANTSGTILTAL